MYFYIPVRRLTWCALIGHFLLSSISIKYLHFTIFWAPDEVGDETNVWWVTNFCTTNLITGLEIVKFRHLMVIE